MHKMKQLLLEASELNMQANLKIHEAMTRLVGLSVPNALDEEPLTVDEVARRLSLSLDRTREKLANGEISAKKVGRRWLVMPSDLQAYLRGGA